MISLARVMTESLIVFVRYYVPSETIFSILVRESDEECEERVKKIYKQFTCEMSDSGYM